MLSVSNLSVRLGDLLLFENASFSIDRGDRVGLVGANGSGKSSLLRVLAGEIPATTGSISIAPGTTIGYLRQGFGDLPGGTLADLLDVPTHGLYVAMHRLDGAMAAYAEPHLNSDAVDAAYADALAAFEQLGGYDLLTEIAALLDRFDLHDMPLDRPLASLSGGQKTRAGLAALLATRPDLLILDEPTNQLDEAALAWLQSFLASYSGAFIIVSHDRAFLDDTVTEILAIDHQRIRRFVGKYRDYRVVIEHEREEAVAAWHRQQAEVDRIERDIRTTEAKARTIENSTVDFAIRKKAAKIARPMVVRKAKLERMLDSTDAAEKPERRWGLHMNIADVADGASNVVACSNVSFSYDNTPVLRDLSVYVQAGDRIGITGANGSGKTTLMRILGGYLQPDTGSVRRGPGVKIGYFSQEQETLDPELTVLQQANRIVAISETELRNELHKFLFGGDTVHRLIRDLSYGERARLMLAMLALQRTTLLLLDEPLNHLDIDARENFEQALLQFNGTMLMVLHDRYAIERLATRVWLVADGNVSEGVSSGPA